jgi:hypothetical protein
MIPLHDRLRLASAQVTTRLPTFSNVSRISLDAFKFMLRRSHCHLRCQTLWSRLWFRSYLCLHLRQSKSTRDGSVSGSGILLSNFPPFSLLQRNLQKHYLERATLKPSYRDWTDSPRRKLGWPWRTPWKSSTGSSTH